MSNKINIFECALVKQARKAQFTYLKSYVYFDVLLIAVTYKCNSCPNYHFKQIELPIFPN